MILHTFFAYVYYCRERILGENNPDLLQSIIYRGAVYADAQQYTPCILLWSHALKIANHNKHSIQRDLLRFTQVTFYTSKIKKCT